MARVSDPYKLILLFSPVWAEAHGGVEYEPDGRDFKGAKMFLEIQPGLLASQAKQEEFGRRAWEYMGDEFYDKPYGSPPLNHQLFHFLNHYASYGKTKMQVKPKVKQVLMITCSDCGETEHPANEQCPKCHANKIGG